MAVPLAYIFMIVGFIRTWVADDGVPVSMVQRVTRHEWSFTPLDHYIRRTDDHGRVRRRCRLLRYQPRSLIWGSTCVFHNASDLRINSG